MSVLLSLAAADRRALRRGLALLIVIVVAGVVIVEAQLSRLTQRPEFAQALGLRREADGYWRVYALGAGGGVRSVYQVGTIASSERSLTVGVAGHSLTLPTILYLDIGRQLYWLEVWHRQFLTEAVKTKEELAGQLAELRPFLRKLVEDIRR